MPATVRRVFRLGDHDAASGRVIALHHYGGSQLPEQRDAMSLICADAGALLSCAP